MANKKNKAENPDISVEGMLQKFRAEYELSLRQLATLLDEANISHYSSGCGTKRVTFDLFPASAYVEEFLTLLTMDRAPRKEFSGGFMDANPVNNYNPGHDFILYLRRWQHFVEQVMRNEGDTDRGISAAKAKLLLDELTECLGENKNGSMLKNTHLAALMRIIALKLETTRSTNANTQEPPRKLRGHHNYLKALAAAQKEKEALNRNAS